MPGFFQVQGQAFCLVFCLGEDQGGFRLFLGHDAFQHGGLILFCDLEEHMGDGRNGLGVIDLDDCRVIQDIFRQMPDFRRHGGGKNEVLALGRQVLHDPPDIRQETLVEHMVGLIENQHLNLPEVYGFVIQVIKQASGAGNDNFRAFSDFFDLTGLADPAIDNPGGSNDKRTYFFAGSGLQALQERKHKGGGLAGARLGEAKDIAAGENGRHGLALDGGW